MRIHPNFVAAALLALAALIGISSTQAAETVCKGKATAACTGETNCSWVKPYKLKGGKDVAGFCRKKPSHKAAAGKAGS